MVDNNQQGAAHVGVLQQHGGAVLAALAKLREEDALIDCVLALGKGEDAELVPVHATVAAACSPFVLCALRVQWARQCRWRGRTVWRVDVEDVPGAGGAVRALVSFMYSGEMPLLGPDAAYAGALWAAAIYLHMGCGCGV